MSSTYFDFDDVLHSVLLYAVFWFSLVLSLLFILKVFASCNNYNSDNLKLLTQIRNHIEHYNMYIYFYLQIIQHWRILYWWYRTHTQYTGRGTKSANRSGKCCWKCCPSSKRQENWNDHIQSTNFRNQVCEWQKNQKRWKFQICWYLKFSTFLSSSKYGNLTSTEILKQDYLWQPLKAFYFMVASPGL